MTKIRKITAVLLSLVILVCSFSVIADALSADDFAEELAPMEYASDKLKDGHNEAIYKIKLGSSGTIKFHCSDYYQSSWTPSNPTMELLDSNFKVISTPNSVGGVAIGHMVERGFTIPKKGTYYLKITKGKHEVYFNNLYYTFVPDEEASVSIGISMKVGTSIDLVGLTSNYSGKVVWKSTKKSVATVNNGTVKAKKAGTTIIRLYMNDGSYDEITVKVTKK